MLMQLARPFPLRGSSLIALAALAGMALPAQGAAQAHSTSAPVKLVLYSAQGYDSTMAKAYTATGAAQVSLVDDSTGNILARIQAEKNNPHWDIVWFDGDGTMRSLADQNLLLTHWTPANSANYTAFGKKLIPSDHAYFPTGVTAAGVIIYNTKKLTPAQAPADWTDLLTPRFKDAVAENDPAFSGPAFPYIAGQIVRQGSGNVARGEAFFTKLKANGLKIFQTNDPTLHSVQTGARLVGVVQDSAYYAAAVTGAPLGVVYPKSGVTALPGVIAINARSPHVQAAEAFVNYVLSQAGQHTMIHDPNDSDSFYTPIIAGVSALPAVKSRVSSFQLLDPIWAGAHATEIKTWFHSNIVQ
jgi:iron(III) transport system substrate-binding protein